VLDGRTSEAVAFSDYQTTRDRMLADVFDLTCALCEFPPPRRFFELHRELGRAVDFEAATRAEQAFRAPGEVAA
jgi:hypothetical protein